MTQQVPDILILEGKTRFLHNLPWWPEDHNYIVRNASIPIDSIDSWFVNTTCCWREYRATWEVRGSQLWLNELLGRWTLLGDFPLVCSWYSGRLIVAADDPSYKARSLFGDHWEREIWIEVENGRILASRSGSRPSSPIF